MEKAYRIKKNQEIDALVKQRNSAANSFFVVYAAVNKIDHFRFAVSVSKKYGNAVERNKIKRRIREITRQANITAKTDFLIVAKPTARKLDFKEIKDNLTPLFVKAKIT